MLHSLTPQDRVTLCSFLFSYWNSVKSKYSYVLLVSLSDLKTSYVMRVFIWSLKTDRICKLSRCLQCYLWSWCTAWAPSSHRVRLLAPPLPALCHTWTWSLCGIHLHHHPPGPPHQMPTGQRSAACSATVTWPEFLLLKIWGSSPVRPRPLCVCTSVCLQTVYFCSQTEAWTGQYVRRPAGPAEPGQGPDHYTPDPELPAWGWSPLGSHPSGQRSHFL